MSNPSTIDESQESSLHFLDYWRVIRNRKEIILAVIFLVVLTGTLYTFSLPKIYMANTRITVREDAMDVDVFKQQFIAGYNPFFLKTQYEVIQSRPILYQVIENLSLQQIWSEQYAENGQQLPREDSYRILKGSLGVQQYRDTSLIEIQVRREKPEEATRIANEVASVYRDQRLQIKRREEKRGVESLENELRKQQEKVDQAEKELQEIRIKYGVTEIAKGYQMDKVRLQALEGERSQARVDMLTRQARMDQLATLEGDELLNASTYVVNDTSIQNVRRQLLDGEVTLKQMQENFGENHPEVKRVKALIDETKKQLLDALAGLKIGVKADFEVAKARYQAIDVELKAAKDLDREEQGSHYLPFDKAQRNVDLQRDILNALRARVTQQGIEMEVPRTPVEVVEPAEVPSRPVSPNMMLNIIISIFLGLGAGVGLAYFIEYLDTSVKTVDDVERYLGAPVLGVIPQKVKPLIEEGPDSPHAEAYRVLRTNIQFANKGVHGGCFGVMSGGVGEGKSTTLFNLAYVCAQLGDKVLIVDSDLRRPVQHKMFSMSNRLGLTNALLRDVPVEELIKPTAIPNLHFLPSGRTPKAAVGLLDSQRMRELAKNLKARYDYVFFDSPPLVGVSDASVLASEVDAVLLVVQYRKYPRHMSGRAKRMLDNVGANVVGVVLNNINILRDDYYYYYNSYYSHYEQSEDSKLPSEGQQASEDKTEAGV